MEMIMYTVLIFLTGAAVGGAAMTCILYRKPFGMLHLNETDPYKELITVEFYEEIRNLDGKDEIVLKVDRS